MNSGEASSEEDVAGEEGRDADRSESEESTIETQRQISLAREGIYMFLSRVFLYEVDNEFLTVIAAVQPTVELLASSQRGEVLKKASETLATFSEKAAALEGEERKKLLTELAIEFASLFLTSGKELGHERVWPWESAYFTEPPRTFSEPYHECIQAYKLVGYEKPKDSNEPEDHLAFQLDFMAHLSRLALASIDSGKIDFALGYVRLQKEFLKDHLLRWVGKFSARLAEKSKRRPVEFYRAIAMVLETFVTLDDHTLDDVAEKLKAISDAQQEKESELSRLTEGAGTAAAA